MPARDISELTQIGELSDDNLSYEFNMLRVWFDPVEGEVYWTRDAGCSCPTPFENCHTTADLTRLAGVDAIEQFEREVEGFPDTQEAKQRLRFLVHQCLFD